MLFSNVIGFKSAKWSFDSNILINNVLCEMDPFEIMKPNIDVRLPLEVFKWLNPMDLSAVIQRK